jgi:hypothetical protein
MDARVVKVLHDAFKKGMEEPTFRTRWNGSTRKTST